MTKPQETDTYREFRKKVVSFVRADIVGPSEEAEVIADKPTWRYASGVLFPLEDDSESVQQTSGGDDETQDMEYREEDLDTSMERTSSYLPSAMGLSFLVPESCGSVSVAVKAGRYIAMKAEDFKLVRRKISDIPETLENDPLFKEKCEYKDGVLSLRSPITKEERDRLVERCGEHRASKNAMFTVFSLLTTGWRRELLESKSELKTSSRDTADTVDGLKLVCRTRDAGNGLKLCTVAIVNNTVSAKPQSDNTAARFQVYMEIEPAEKGHFFHDFAESQRAHLSDDEEQSMDLLYRSRKTFATGHGCSADWEPTDDRMHAVRVHTEVMPSCEMPQMVFTLPESSRNIDPPSFSMSSLAFDDASKVTANLGKLADRYEEWIGEIEKFCKTLESKYQSAAARHVSGCKEALARIRKGIDIIKKDETCMHAFQLANHAMLMQRCHTELQREKKEPDAPFEMPEYRAANHEWRPFQIAFILLNLESIADHESEYRDTVDLIWFPTGGGKTEAYLGLTAFTIFLRRLRGEADVSGGTTVIMRYTLRLLTSQQFQRACTLICACESIRNSQGGLGNDKISIGLWVGGGSTPNKRAEARKRLEMLDRQPNGNANNPFQVLSCPWCGTHMVRRNGSGMNAYEIKSKPTRFAMWCPNASCEFSKELPINIIDEDIYDSPPTLLFGTVDKFANIPWQENASSIFALDEGNRRPSPELIIQDELHLISGSLGTMVGLYETAIDIFCSQKGPRTKIIASTATVRRAAEQCNALYGRALKQFPSPGIDAADSFFAREAKLGQTSPGRLYVGVMPSGKTFTTTQVRLMADCIQGVQLEEGDEKTKDPLWTQVVYCNSIRELGRTKTVTYDDVKEHSQTLCERYGKQGHQRYFNDKAVRELTSRIPAEDIPDILQRLFVSHPDKEAIDVLLATNMISVGVDVDRLGLMVILGQPKTTSEYIQASSRVGRKYPGLVFMLASSVKSRDRSHYEQFRQYHQSIYRHVEPTSVTPFSPPAREKALHAVLISIIRHVGGLGKNEDLKKLDVSDPRIRNAVKLLMDRVRTVDKSEEEATEGEVDRILSEIQDLTKLEGGATYASTTDEEKNPIMRPAESDRRRGKFATMRSMRSTDAECNIFVPGMMAVKNKSKIPTLRRSQTVTTFGVGSIVDLTSGSVMVCGIEKWPQKACVYLSDPRLQEKLHAPFFLMPPDKEDSNEGIPAVRFPLWMRCRKCNYIRPIEAKSEAEKERPTWRKKWENAKRPLGDFDMQPRCDTCLIPLIPSRFVVACRKGHINDFPFIEWVHGEQICTAPDLKYLKRGSTASLSGITIKCENCPKKRHMGDSFSKEVLASVSKCKGGKPWAGVWESSCGEELTTLQRGATNIHYSIVRSSILIPPYSTESVNGMIRSTRIWERYESGLGVIEDTPEGLKEMAKWIAEEIGRDFDEVHEAVLELTGKSEAKAGGDRSEEEYRLQEFNAFLGNYEKGSCDERDFMIENSPLEEDTVPGIRNLVLVKKLRETRIQTAFTRINPLSSEEEGEAEEERVIPVPVSSDRSKRWLPGYEVRGEGLFLELSPTTLERWSKIPSVKARSAILEKRFAKRPDAFGTVKTLSPEFILLHTLSHLLIRQLSFECGYSSSSLRERVYCSSPGSRKKMYGVLIYTAEGDSDGTMGGLVSQGKEDNFQRVFYDAIRGAQWCSSDPLCIECEGQGFNAMSMGACHACTMLPETSCESMNRYLDRALLIGTMDDPSLGFFSEWFERITREGM